MSKPMISTVRGLVDAYGGTFAMAEYLGVVPSSVSNMIADNHIPRGYHLKLYLDSKRRRLRLDTLALFEIDTDEFSRSA